MKKLRITFMALLVMLMLPIASVKADAAQSKKDVTDKYICKVISVDYISPQYKVAFYTEKDAIKEEKRLRKQKKWKKLSKNYSALARANFLKKKYTIIRVDWTVTNTKKFTGKSKYGQKMSYQYWCSEILYDSCPEMIEKGTVITSYILMYPKGDKKHDLWREDVIL